MFLFISALEQRKERQLETDQSMLLSKLTVSIVSDDKIWLNLQSIVLVPCELCVKPIDPL